MIHQIVYISISEGIQTYLIPGDACRQFRYIIFIKIEQPILCFPLAFQVTHLTHCFVSFLIPGKFAVLFSA